MSQWLRLAARAGDGVTMVTAGFLIAARDNDTETDPRVTR